MHTDGLVANDQSGWGFSVKQGATTVREDSAAYTVSNSTLTMEVEAVTLALRWIALRGDSRTTYAIIFTDSVSLLQIVQHLNGKPRLKCVNGRHPPSKPPVGVLLCICRNEEKCPRRLVGKATLASGFLLERSEVLRSLRHYLRAQSQGQHTIDRLEQIGVERGSVRRSSLKGRERAIVNQTNIGTVSKAALGKPLSDGV